MIDLHMHSLYSDDGEYSPTRLAEMCSESGVTVMSVTDHNCVRANAEAAQAAERLGIRYLTGTEIDCTYQGVNFHMLGYGIDCESEDFVRIEKHVDEQDLAASLERLEKIQSLGFRVSENEMWELSKDRYKKEIWTGEMFAELLLSKEEYADHPLLSPYRPGGARSDNPLVNFYWDYYSQGKPCHVKMDYPAMEEIVSLLHANRGIAVLAHPGVNLKGNFALLDGILGLGVDGIEAYNSYHTPPESEYFHRRAEEKGLLITCGSDYHGRNKPAIRIGQCGQIKETGLDYFLGTLIK